MSVRRAVSAEFHSALSSPLQRISVIAIAFIPILYAGTFLWAFWNPYGHLNRMPVAVVNEDRGATVSGQSIHAGSQLVNQLKRNRDFDWHFVTPSEASRGLVDNQYFMVIEIPSDFSAEAAQASTSNHAGQPKLVVTTNNSYNYIASIIGRNAIDQIRAQTAQRIATTYTSGLVTGLAKLQQGLRQAHRGAGEVASGAGRLSSSSNQLHQGALQVSQGATELQVDAVRAATAAQSIAKGTGALYQGSGQLANGMRRLQNSGQTLGRGAVAIGQGTSQLQKATSQSSNAAGAFAQGAAQTANGWAQYAALHPSLLADPQFQALLGASKQLANKASTLAAGEQNLATGAAQLAGQYSQFQSGLNLFLTGVGQTSQGAQTLVRNEAALVQGTNQLASGLRTLAAASGQLQAGTAKLQSGARQLSTGAAQLAKGTDQMATQLSRAVSHTPNVYHQQLVSAISNPVGLTLRQYGQVSNYGQGFAPYFLSLGLYVGALLMSIIVPFRDPPEQPGSGLAWFVSKLAVLASIAVVQTLVADVVLLFGVKLHVQHALHFVWFSLLTAVAFLALIQFLVTVAANPGRFIALLILIVQLTASSGTYPVILSPRFFQVLHPILPMTYSVDGFRHLIGATSPAAFWTDVRVLAIIAIAFLACTLAYFLIVSNNGDPNRSQRHKKRRLHARSRAS